MAFYTAGRSIPDIEADIRRHQASKKIFETLTGSISTLLIQLEAELVVAKQLQDAQTWPRFVELQDEILAVLDLDSKRVAAAKKLDWNRPYEYTLKSAYDYVLKRTQDREKRWKLVLDVYSSTQSIKSDLVYLRAKPNPKPTHYYPGVRVQYKPNARKPALWSGLVIPRPAQLGYPAYSHVTHGLLTYVIRDDGTIRGCFAVNLELVP